MHILIKSCLGRFISRGGMWPRPRIRMAILLSVIVWIRMCIARLMRMTSQSQFSGPLNRTSNSPPCRIWGSPLTTPGETLSQRLRMTPSGLCRCTQSQGIEKRSLKESCPSSQKCLIRRYQCARAVSARVSTRTHSPSLSGLSRPGCPRRL